jgi:hypothetical protein
MAPSPFRRALVRVSLSLYPAAWKARYRDEVRDVAESLGVTWHSLFDLLRGAVQEQLWPSVRYRDSAGALLARIVLACVVFISEVTVRAAILMSRAPRTSVGVVDAMVGPLWTMPFPVAVLAFVCFRHVFARRSRVVFAGVVILATIAVTFAWIATASGAWSLLAYPSALLRAAPVLVTLASMHACQTMVVFLILDRRTIAPGPEQAR